jgi:hypothetical protein
LNQGRICIGALLRQGDSIAEREASSVAAIDPDEGARVSAKGDHLLEDRVEHQLAQGDLSSLRESDQHAAGAGGDSNDLRVADIRHQGRLDVMGADDECLPIGSSADQHATVEARRRGQVAKRKRVTDLLLDNVFERLAITAPKGREGR